MISITIIIIKKDGYTYRGHSYNGPPHAVGHTDIIFGFLLTFEKVQDTGEDNGLKAHYHQQQAQLARTSLQSIGENLDDVRQLEQLKYSRHFHHD